MASELNLMMGLKDVSHFHTLIALGEIIFVQRWCNSQSKFKCGITNSLLLHSKHR